RCWEADFVSHPVSDQHCPAGGAETTRVPASDARRAPIRIRRASVGWRPWAPGAVADRWLGTQSDALSRQPDGTGPDASRGAGRLANHGDLGYTEVRRFPRLATARGAVGVPVDC